MPKLIEIKQDTDAWHSWRKNGLGSSELGILAGFNKYKTAERLWAEKMGLLKSEKAGYAAERGKSLEEVARDIYNFSYNIHMEPKCFEHEAYPFMRVSLDGWNDEHKYLVEIKCPMNKEDLALGKAGIIPIKYYPQVQYQMLVTSAQFADYITYEGDDKVYVKRVYADRRYQNNLRRLAIWFWHKIENKIEIKNYSVKLHETRIHINEGLYEN